MSLAVRRSTINHRSSTLPSRRMCVQKWLFSSFFCKLTAVFHFSFPLSSFLFSSRAKLSTGYRPRSRTIPSRQRNLSGRCIVGVCYFGTSVAVSGCPVSMKNARSLLLRQRTRSWLSKTPSISIRATWIRLSSTHAESISISEFFQHLDARVVIP